MQIRYLYIIRIFLAFSDLLLLNTCLYAAYSLTLKYGRFVDSADYNHMVIIANLIWFVSAGLGRMYEKYTLYKLSSIYRATWKSVVLHGLLFMVYIYLENVQAIPRNFIFLFYVMLSAGFMVSRFVGTALEATLTEKFDVRKAVAILSRNSGGLKLAAYLEEQNAYNFQGFLEEEIQYTDNGGQLMPAALTQLKAAARSGIRDVFVSITPDRLADISNLLKEAEKHCIRLKFVPDLNSVSSPFNVEHMGGFTVLSARREPLENFENRLKKRFSDVLISSLVIVFILSWLFPLLALIIKLESKGPVYFKQKRSGRNNVPFWCYKFRSMRVNNDHRHATVNDERVTRVGKFIRKTSIDELLQFLNVFAGDMSVVGPRPHMVDHTEEYRAIIDQYMVRQFLKPGITGWAQVNGYRGGIKELHQMQKRVEHDIWYIENWSAMIDIQIIFLTIFNVIKGEANAY